jgi:hypothetical protein
MPSDESSAVLAVKDDLTMPVMYKNGKFFAAFSWMVIVGAAVLSVIMVVMAVSALLPLRGFSFGKAIDSVFLLGAAASFGSMSWGLVLYVRRLSFYHVRLDSQGVEFLFGTRKNPERVEMQWDQVCAVQHWRVVNEHRYKVTSKGGSYANFTSNTFFGAKKMARRIAAHANVSIQED